MYRCYSEMQTKYLFFFSLKIFIYLKGNVIQREGEVFHLLVHFPSRSLMCLPKCINRKLDAKQSRQDSDWCSHGMPVLQAVA